MKNNEEILKRIRKSVREIEPDATVILYGSFARGKNRLQSDLDVLILLNKNKITREDEIKIKYPLYDIEFETGQIISPVILAKDDWEPRHRITPFYENVKQEGVVL